MDNLKKLTDKNYIKQLNNDNIDFASGEIRKFLIKNVFSTGGHLASNLGVVELTLALHKVFDFPKDKIIFDVGHQCYVHKILSGRYDRFSTLRQKNGLSGFPKTQESDYDSFNTGHSSTSISAALGMARARDLNKDNHNIIAFIGDGAIGGGMAFEALNDAGDCENKIIIVLNDNEMSINQNVGGLSSHLSMLRLNPNYIKAKSRMHHILDKTGFLGRFFTKIVRKVKNMIKSATIRVPLFEELGIKYIGIIDGHNFDDLTEALEKAKKSDKSVIVHVSTVKGKGYESAEENPAYYHGVSAKKPCNPSNHDTFTSVFGKYLAEKAEINNKIVSITAAMCSGCGLNEFSQKFPDRFYDVGIAEEHAVTMSAGLSKGGLIPVFSVYSTFLQRGYDQILHDICLQNLHVIFAIDRSGIVGEDGETHQGIFDLSYLSHLPNMTILAPSSKEELQLCMDYAIDVANGPVSIRFPKDTAPSITQPSFNLGSPHTVSKTGDDIVIISIGRMLDTSKRAVRILEDEGYCSVHLLNMCTVKPLNSTFYDNLVSKSKITITVEDNILSGGAGEYLASQLSRSNKAKIINIGFDNVFVEQGTQEELFEAHNVTPNAIVYKVKKGLENNE